MNVDYSKSESVVLQDEILHLERLIEEKKRRLNEILQSSPVGCTTVRDIIAVEHYTFKKSLRRIAQEYGYSYSHIRKVHAKMKRGNNLSARGNSFSTNNTVEL